MGSIKPNHVGFATRRAKRTPSANKLTLAYISGHSFQFIISSWRLENRLRRLLLTLFQGISSYSYDNHPLTFSKSDVITIYQSYNHHHCDHTS